MLERSVLYHFKAHKLIFVNIEGKTIYMVTAILGINNNRLKSYLFLQKGI